MSTSRRPKRSTAALGRGIDGDRVDHVGDNRQEAVGVAGTLGGLARVLVSSRSTAATCVPTLEREERRRPADATAGAGDERDASAVSRSHGSDHMMSSFDCDEGAVAVRPRRTCSRRDRRRGDARPAPRSRGGAEREPARERGRGCASTRTRRSRARHLHARSTRSIRGARTSPRGSVRAGGPTLLLNGHTDTMPPGEGWTTDPFAAIVRDGKLYGLGACDMKAGVAAMTEAVLAVKRAAIPLRGRVYLDAVVDEEATGRRDQAHRRAGPASRLRHHRRADRAAGPAPRQRSGELRRALLRDGPVTARLPRPAETRSPTRPRSSRLSKRKRRGSRRSPYPLIGPASYNIGRIRGGLQTSIIPSECHVGVDRRIVPGQSVHDAIADLEQLLERSRASVRDVEPSARSTSNTSRSRSPRICLAAGATATPRQRSAGARSASAGCARQRMPSTSPRAERRR